MLTNVIYLLIHFATTGMYDYIKQHENIWVSSFSLKEKGLGGRRGGGGG